MLRFACVKEPLLERPLWGRKLEIISLYHLLFSNGLYGLFS
jgi:hypothetical protein